MLLFTTEPDGKPVEFHMMPCSQKQALQSLIEVSIFLQHVCKPQIASVMRTFYLTIHWCNGLKLCFTDCDDFEVNV